VNIRKENKKRPEQTSTDRSQEIASPKTPGADVSSLELRMQVEPWKGFGERRRRKRSLDGRLAA